MMNIEKHQWLVKLLAEELSAEFSESFVKFVVLFAGLVSCNRVCCFWSQELPCSNTMLILKKNNKMIKPKILISLFLYMGVYIT
jgi:hypothetical protein